MADDPSGGDARSEAPPIVCIPGFLALGDPWDVEALRCRFPQQRFICVTPGPISSHHDRAVDIFYALKGGRADYGEAHSRAYDHARFGRTHVAAYPKWDARHPVHLLGHSIGGMTARMLQRLLADGAFDGHVTSADWVISVTALSSPLNGDWVPHALGAQACEPPSPIATRIRPGSTGWMLTLLIHLLGFADLAWVRKRVDLGLDHWRLSRHHGWAALRTLLLAVLWRSSLGQNCDNAAHDVCYHNTAALNQRLEAFPTTFYFSFVGCRPTPSLLGSRGASSPYAAGWAWLRSGAVALFGCCGQPALLQPPPPSLPPPSLPTAPAPHPLVTQPLSPIRCSPRCSNPPFFLRPSPRTSPLPTQCGAAVTAAAMPPSWQSASCSTQASSPQPRPHSGPRTTAFSPKRRWPTR